MWVSSGGCWCQQWRDEELNPTGNLVFWTLYIKSVLIIIILFIGNEFFGAIHHHVYTGVEKTILESSYQTETLRGLLLGKHSNWIGTRSRIVWFKRDTCNEQDVPDAHQLKVALELPVIRLPTCRLICNGLGHRGTLLGTKFVVSVSRWR